MVGGFDVDKNAKHWPKGGPNKKKLTLGPDGTGLTPGGWPGKTRTGGHEIKKKKRGGGGGWFPDPGGEN